MIVSIIIPTYNRTDELKETLRSILNQTMLPIEVIIVDDSNNNEVENVVHELDSKFKKRSISLNYLKNNKGRSLTAARNLGVKESCGEIILFLDDDVLLDKNYIEELLLTYHKHPNAKGVQGYWANNYKMTYKLSMLNMANKFFYHFHYKINDCRILPSFNSTYPYMLKKTIQCEYLSGCNCSFLRDIFDEMEFDECLKKYSYGEDRDFPYRIHLKYPGSLYITPSAKLVHKQTLTARIPSREFIYMNRIYTYYLFHKNINKTFINNILFNWSLFGDIILMFCGILLPMSKPRNYYVHGLQYTFESIKVCYRHRRELQNGDLSFFDKYIKY